MWERLNNLGFDDAENDTYYGTLNAFLVSVIIALIIVAAAF